MLGEMQLSVFFSFEFGVASQMQSRNNVEISILGDNLTQDIIEYKKNGKGSSICINRRLVKRERESNRLVCVYSI